MPRKLRLPWHEVLLECVKKHTEAPDRFITWSAFSVIGSVMKRKFFVKDGIFTLYPNQYIVLVAPPGVGKGTAVRFAWDFVKSTHPNQLANMISDQVTYQRIIQRIADGWNQGFTVVPAPGGQGAQVIQGAKDHTCTIFSTELATLVSTSEQMLNFLCEAWDKNDYDYDTKVSGSAFIPKDSMCTSLIACTVPDFVRAIDRSTNLTIKGGYTARCLFIYEEHIARNLPFPPPIERNKQSMALLSDLKDDLADIAQLPGGEFNYDTISRIKFEDYINRVRSKSTYDIEAVAYFKSRIKAHILKLAMVLSISRHNTLMIEAQDMVKAIELVDDCLNSMEKIFRGSGDSDAAGLVAHVQDYIENRGACSKKEILTALHRHLGSVDNLDRILYVLQEIDYLEYKTIGNTTMYSMKKKSNGYYASNGTKVGVAQPQPQKIGASKP